VVVWYSGSALVLINVALHRARLVPGWVAGSVFKWDKVSRS